MNVGDDRDGRATHEGQRRGGCLTAFLITGLILFAIGTAYLVIICIGTGFPIDYT